MFHDADCVVSLDLLNSDEKIFRVLRFWTCFRVLRIAAAVCISGPFHRFLRGSCTLSYSVL